MLESGQYATVNELAKGENMNASYVAHVLRLTLLAPVLDGLTPIEFANRSSMDQNRNRLSL
jgi:hypothetical protein